MYCRQPLKKISNPVQDEHGTHSDGGSAAVRNSTCKVFRWQHAAISQDVKLRLYYAFERKIMKENVPILQVQRVRGALGTKTVIPTKEMLGKTVFKVFAVIRINETMLSAPFEVAPQSLATPRAPPPRSETPLHALL